MVKSWVVSAALTTIILLSSTANNNAARAFQPSRQSTLSLSSLRRIGAPSATSFRAATTQSSLHRCQHTSSTNMATGRNENTLPSQNQISLNSLFQSTTRRLRRALHSSSWSFTVLLASLAFFFSSMRVVPAPPAHATSALAAAVTSSSLSLTQRLNPFRTRSVDEMIDAYVRDRLFVDDEYDPVESAYREAYADYGVGRSAGKDGATGTYPALLAETVGSALGQSGRSVSTILSSSGTSAAARGVVGSVSASPSFGKNDGITAVLIKVSDFLQNKLRVSASVSYYILAALGLLGICVLPGMLGVLYQGLQRLQLDRSEMKMYGKVTDMDATSKKVADDDDDDDDGD